MSHVAQSTGGERNVQKYIQRYLRSEKQVVRLFYKQTWVNVQGGGMARKHRTLHTSRAKDR